MKNKILSLFLFCNFIASTSFAQSVDGPEKQDVSFGSSLTVSYPTGITSVQGINLSCAGLYLSDMHSFRNPCFANRSRTFYSSDNGILANPDFSSGTANRFLVVTPDRFNVPVYQPRTLFDHPGSQIILHIGKDFLHRAVDFNPFYQHSDYRRFAPRTASEFEYLIGRFRSD